MVVIYLQSIKPVMILRRDMDGLAGRTSMQYGMTTSLLPANHESFRFFWLKASFMKKHYALLVLALIFVIASFVILSTRPRAKDFCSGTQLRRLRRIEFEGQGRCATLMDYDSLRYLSSQSKLESLPENVRLDA